MEDLSGFVYDRPSWPDLRWDGEAIATALAQIHFRRGRLLASVATLGFDMRTESALSVLVRDVTATSEIEGEFLSRDEVRSSIARRLGLETGGLQPVHRDVEGVVDMMLDATQRFAAPLDAERLYAWHSALFPTGRAGMRKIRVGGWRDDATGPMQVVSGGVGRERVHFEAPAAERIDGEMERFIAWFASPGLDPVLKAALAHLRFVTIHPFDDGNGRIARAITDLALARADGTESRFYSMSSEILKEKNAYYDVLERTQRGPTDVTGWVVWFLDRMKAALDSAEGVLVAVRRKTEFWDRYRQISLHERQTKIVNLLLDGFEGKLRTSKYAKLTRVSDDSALRDLNDLVAKGVLVRREAGGRSTHYDLANFSDGSSQE